MAFLALAENSIQLIPDGTLLLHVGIIVAMVGLLNLTLFRPINRILEQRELLTRGRLSEAEKTRLRVREMMTQYETHLREARSEGYKLLESNRTRALQEREQKLASLKLEIAERLGQEKSQLSDQSLEVREQLRIEARRIGAEIGSHILGRTITRTDSELRP